ncbi:hypothetical protein J2T21_003196 [Paeniglutamicibacter psychrophenolicus]|nr:hypothetical protein [Paeniglutamicibacter psychrophenolicus]
MVLFGPGDTFDASWIGGCLNHAATAEDGNPRRVPHGAPVEGLGNGVTSNVARGERALEDRFAGGSVQDRPTKFSRGATPSNSVH